MKLLFVRNINDALPQAIKLLSQERVRCESRNGPVLLIPGGVTTVYSNPTERVLFSAQRDCNVALHLYESAWMISGRQDVAPLIRYTKQFEKYTDDGRILHGAYGYRWRQHFGFDQLEIIAVRLRKDPTDRRCVLQMWDAKEDLGKNFKDHPCNVIATFQRDTEGKLDLTVFQRSGDIVWGVYGANAVHMSLLQEFMAGYIGCSVGTYTQVTVNWHSYLDTFEKVKGILPDKANFVENPYADNSVRVLPMMLDVTSEQFMRQVHELLIDADTGFIRTHIKNSCLFVEMCYIILKAHDLWRTLAAPERYTRALEVLQEADQSVDWIVAMREWIQRRQKKFDEKMEQK